MKSSLDQINERGFVVLPKVVEGDVVTNLKEAVAGLEQGEGVRAKADRVYAIRNLLSVCKPVRRLAETADVRSVIEPIIGTKARVVRAILFDKLPGANWKVAWHQDLSIAVRERKEVVGFGPWSVKADVVHVQPPVAILERMITLRLHLDDCGEGNGPLRVIAGSHRNGALSSKAVDEWRTGAKAESCLVPAGGAVLMRPLLLHASSTAVLEGHRRVIHLEWSADALPCGLQWNEG